VRASARMSDREGHDPGLHVWRDLVDLRAESHELAAPAVVGGGMHPHRAARSSDVVQFPRESEQSSAEPVERIIIYVRGGISLGVATTRG
jgi:hypothetical protein